MLWVADAVNKEGGTLEESKLKWEAERCNLEKEVAAAVERQKRDVGKITTLTEAVKRHARQVDSDRSKIAELEAANKKIVKEAGEIGAYYSMMSRMEMIKKFNAGQHLDWNLEEELKNFHECYPPDKPVPGDEIFASLDLSDEEVADEDSDGDKDDGDGPGDDDQGVSCVGGGLDDPSTSGANQAKNAITGDDARDKDMD